MTYKHDGTRKWSVLYSLPFSVLRFMLLYRHDDISTGSLSITCR